MLNPRQNQRGRSLLEMIAVMAIMAMLAGISISWLRGAITRQEADRDYEDIQLFISAVRNQGTLRTDKGMADAFLSYKKTRSGKNLFKLDNCPQNTKGMTIRVDDIDDKTCERLMKKKWDGPFKPLLFLRAGSGQNVCSWNGTDGAVYRLSTSADCIKDGAPEQGAFAVVFNDKRDSVVSCTEDTECGECEYCSAKGICENACTEGQTCAREFETPGTPKECYPTDHIVDGVYCANPDGEGNCCDSNGANCCPPDKPIMGRNGTCYGCDENVKIEVDQRTEKCTRCANRSYRNARYGWIGWCMPDECPEDQPLRSYMGVCSACGSQVDMRDLVVKTSVDTTSCNQCSENSLFDDRFCLVCPDNMVVQDGHCVCSEGFTGYTNNSTNSTTPACFSCGEENLNAFVYNYGNREDPCSACPNRVSVFPNVYYFNYCALETCPDGYMHDRYGNCKSCTQNASFEFQPSSLTNSCSECGGMRYTDGNYCKKCPVDTSGLTAEQRAECTNDCLVYNTTTKIWENKCTRVAYLESTGTQYIDTGIIPTKNLSFDATFENPNSPCSNASGCGNVFGTRKGSSNNEYQLTLYNNGSIGVGTRTSGLKFYANVMNHISFDGNETVDINGTKKTIGVSDISDVGTIVLFAIRNLSSVVQYQGGKIYSVKFGNVRDFIPVLDPNGVPAMYDQVEKKLYHNAGTGNFLYGTNHENAPNPSCQNGGSWDTTNHACNCVNNYYGETCENAPLTCQNGGTWNSSTHQCDCQETYIGSTCEIENPCYNLNCGSHGSCSNGVCVCTDNYYGTNCENAPLTCQNGGTWNHSTHQCDCPSGYSGNTCEWGPWIQPILTSNTSHGVLSASVAIGGGSPSANSCNYNSHPAWCAFDNTVGSATSKWVSGSNYNTSAYIVWELPTALKVSSIAFYTTNETNFLTRFPTSITVYGSNDGSDWRQIGSASGYSRPSSSQSKSVPCDSSNAWAYLKFAFVNNTEIAISEIKITALSRQGN